MLGGKSNLVVDNSWIKKKNSKNKLLQNAFNNNNLATKRTRKNYVEMPYTFTYCHVQIFCKRVTSRPVVDLKSNPSKPAIFNFFPKPILQLYSLPVFQALVVTLWNRVNLYFVHDEGYKNTTFSALDLRTNINKLIIKKVRVVNQFFIYSKYKQQTDFELLFQFRKNLP